MTGDLTSRSLGFLERPRWNNAQSCTVFSQGRRVAQRQLLHSYVERRYESSQIRQGVQSCVRCALLFRDQSAATPCLE